MVTSSSQSDSNSPTETNNTAAAAETAAPVENSQESQTLSLGQSWLYAGGALIAVYGLFASVDLLNIGFQSILTLQAEGLLTLAINPWLGLLIGILATALVQSSSIVTTLLVGLVAGGLSITTAIPIVIGANLGTTITNTLVSLGYISDDDAFERGFAAATVHDCFNLIALVIFFPLELLLHPLERLSQWLSSHITDISSTVSLPNNIVSPLDLLLQPTRWLMAYGIHSLPGPWDSLLLFSTSVGGLMIAVTALGWLMKQWLNSPVKNIIYWGIGRGSGLGGLVTGAGVTALLQSSSMATSLLVPLAGSGLATLEDIYPFVLGANIGTCLTALIATLAVNSPVALQLALVHLSYNLLAVILIYSLPILRNVPLVMAQQLATTTKQWRILAIAYVVGVFFLLPFLALWLFSMRVT